MRVIALDPGYDRLGVAVLEGDSATQTLCFSTCITTNQQDPFPTRLATIGQSLHEIITIYQPNTFALETLFFNKNVKTALDVAQARGVLLYIAHSRTLPIFEYSPQAIKLALTGYGKSDKAAVTMMVKRLVPNAPPDALDDEYDAIAVGVTHLAHHSGHR